MGNNSSLLNLNSLNGLASVFLCFSYNDKSFVQGVIYSNLKKQNRDVYVDWNNPATGIGINQKIETSDAFVFVLSLNSLSDQEFSKHITYAYDLNKRLVCVLIDNLDASCIQLNSGLKSANWLFYNRYFNDSDFITKLGRVLDNNIQHLKTHTLLLLMSLKWDSAKRSAELLPSKSEDKKISKRFLYSCGLGYDPFPNQLMLQYITADWNYHYNPYFFSKDVFQKKGKFLTPLPPQQYRAGCSLFICNNLRNMDFVNRLTHSFFEFGHAVNTIDRTQPWSKFDVYSTIDSSDVCVYVLSKASIISESCNWELDYFIKEQKRIVVVVIEPINIHDVRLDLYIYEWLFAIDIPDLKPVMPTLCSFCDSQVQVVKYHSILLKLSKKWAASNYSKQFLMNSSNDSKISRQLLYHLVITSTCIRPFLTYDMLYYILGKTPRQFYSQYSIDTRKLCKFPLILEDNPSFYHYAAYLHTFGGQKDMAMNNNMVTAPVQVVSSHNRAMSFSSSSSPPFPQPLTPLHFPVDDEKLSVKVDDDEVKSNISDSVDIQPLSEMQEGFADINEWTPERVTNLLIDTNMTKYSTLFQEKKVDGPFLMNATVESFRDIGITDENDTLALVNAIKTINECIQANKVSVEQKNSEEELTHARNRVKELEMTVSKLNQHNQTLKDQLESDKEMYNCIICMNSIKSIVFRPCSHLCCCNVCSEPLKECPICKAQIEDKISVFVS